MNTTSDLAALVSKKKVRIAGQGQDVSSFQGLIYARDSVEIRNTTVMGAIVSKDDAATTELENVTAVNVPELANWDIEQHVTLREAMESAAGGLVQNGTSVPDTIGILETDGTFTELNSNRIRDLKSLAARLGPTDPPQPPEYLRGNTWRVLTRRPNGSFGPPPLGSRFDFQDAESNWAQYVREHSDNNVIKVDIFAIDLNRLQSISQTLELLYHNEPASN